MSGLVLESEIDIPGLRPAPGGGGEAEVRLRLGPVPESLPDAEVVDDWCQRAGGDVLLTLGGARFLVRGGREIVVAPGARPETARAVLLADPLAALLQQRGLLPVHASAIEVAGRAVAFAAPAGGGKSTLLAGLYGRGHAMLCDDLCAVERAASGLVVHPSFPVLKLRQAAAGLAGARLSGRAEPVPGGPKHLYRLSEGFETRSLPLAAVYFLRWSRGRAGPSVRPLRRFEAFKALARSVFYGALLPRRSGEDALMAASAELTRTVAAYAFARPRDLGRIDETVERLERDLRGLLRGDHA